MSIPLFDGIGAERQLAKDQEMPPIHALGPHTYRDSTAIREG